MLQSPQYTMIHYTNCFCKHGVFRRHETTAKAVVPKGASTKSPPAAGFLKLPSEAPLHHLLKLPSSSYLNVGMHVHVYAHVSSCARSSYSHAHMHVVCIFLDAASKGSTAERCATGQNCKILQDPSAIVRVCCRAMRWLYSVVRV